MPKESQRIISMNCGCQVSLVNFEQHHSYEGLQEGLPTKQLNLIIVKKFLAIAQNKFHWSNCYLIHPIPEEIIYKGNYPFGKPERLPPKVCIGLFECTDFAKNNNANKSVLTIVWFQRLILFWDQEKFYFPIDSNIMEKIKK